MGKKDIKEASSGNVDWSVFLQEGVIVTLTIKYYRGTTTVDFSELGIDDSADEQLQEFLDEYITPGTKCLIPPEIKGQLKSIETQARNNLKNNGFDCSAFSSTGKFVPKSMYADFKDINEELRDRFYTIRDEFADNYDSIIEKVRRDYKVLASKLYMQSHPQAKRPSPKFVNSFVAQIIEQIADPDDIVASFEFSTALNRIPDYILRVISKKNSIDEKVMRIATSNSLGDLTEGVGRSKKENSKKTSTKETPKRKNKKETRAKTAEDDSLMASIIEIEDEEEYSLLKSDIEEKEVIDEIQEEEDIDEIEQDIRESMSTQSRAQAADFITDIIIKVREDAIEGSDAILASMNRNKGKLIGRASVKAHSLIEDLRKMNFYGDLALEQKVANLEEALGDDKQKRDLNRVYNAVSELNEWALESLEDFRKQNLERKRAAAPPKKNVRSEAAKRASAKNKKTSTNSRAASPKKPKKKLQISVPQNTKRRTIKRRT